MKWKLVGGLAIIALLLFFFFSRTQYEFSDLSKFLPIKTIGKFLEGIQFQIQSLFYPTESFDTIIELIEPSFYGQEMSFDNSTFEAEGDCIYFEVNGVVIEKIKSCKFKSEIRDGNVKFDGIIEISGITNKISINETNYIKENMNFKLVVDPIQFFLGNVQKNRMEIQSATGEIKRYKNGNLDQLKIVNNERIEIINFFGTISLRGGKIILAGTASRIFGDDFDLKK